MKAILNIFLAHQILQANAIHSSITQKQQTKKCGLKEIIKDISIQDFQFKICVKDSDSEMEYDQKEKQQSQFQYPIELAPRGQTVDEFRKVDGSIVKVTDSYRSLEDVNSQQTKNWIQAQNQITKNFLKDDKLREQIMDKFQDSFKSKSYKLPIKHGQHYYYTLNFKRKNHAQIYKVKQKNSQKIDFTNPSEDADLFLDPDSLSKDGTVSIGSKQWSRNGKYMAYQVKQSGSDWATIYVRDCDTFEDLKPDVLKWVKFSGITWTKDNLGFFYARFDAPKEVVGQDYDLAGKLTNRLYHQKVYYHQLGTKQEDDRLIYVNYNEPDWTYGLKVSRDGQYLLLFVKKYSDGTNMILNAKIKDEANYGLPEKINFKSMVSEWIGGFRYIYNEDNHFYFKTNYNAPRQRLIQIDIENPDQKNWREILPEHNKNVLSYVRYVRNELMLVNYMQDASDKLYIYDFKQPAKLIKEIKLPGIGTVKNFLSNYEDNEMFFRFVSFNEPAISFKLDLDTFELEVLHRKKISELVAFSDDFVTDEAFFPSKDGTMVHMFIVRKKSVLPSLDHKPQKPLLTMLYAYGGFGHNQTPKYNNWRMLFMNNLDGIYCLVNIRGGGEYGSKWHSSGANKNKQNSYDDFQAAAEFLQKKGITDSKHTVIMGGSNGGTLVAACANQRPELYGAAISKVPVTDMLRYHKFTIGFKWSSEYGRSDQHGGFDYLIKYSPYHNIKEQKYPAMLVTSGDHDDRVVPLHTYKFVAQLQYTAGKVKNQNPLLALISKNTGHGAGKPLKMRLEEITNIFIFIIKTTGAQWHD